MKHTRGPWTATKIRLLDNPHLRIVDSDMRLLATAWGQGNPEKTEANASLMAASPDLLVALQDVVHRALEIEEKELKRFVAEGQGQWGFYLFPKEIQAILDAIAKATGKEHEND